eukprot:TRINITY_DN1765_c0_g2_i2.p1 TRINITY_DN1765_c0_g2~~TRINITY_DN1765_c0_g2_i2.p1  ORF type:complete len:540 (+),score=153.94 TRINITY_DN1765_c0_g2_i2:329-1948(+)
MFSRMWSQSDARNKSRGGITRKRPRNYNSSSKMFSRSWSQSDVRSKSKQVQQQLIDVQSHVESERRSQQEQGRHHAQETQKLQQQLIDVQSHVESERRSQQEQGRHHAQETQKLQQQLKDVQTQLDAERHLLQEMQQRRTQDQLADMQRQLEAERRLQRELQEHAGQELDKLQHQLKDMQSQLEAEQHSQQKLRQHSAQLQREIEHMQTQLEAERNSRQQESEELEGQLADVKSELDAERRSQQDLQQQHAAQQAEDLRHQLADMQGQLEELEELLEQERVGAQQLRLRLDLPAEKAAAETKLRNMRRRLAAARGEEVEESDELQDLPASSGSLIDRIASLEAARDDLARSLETERKSANALRVQLDRALDQQSSHQPALSLDQTLSRPVRNFNEDYEEEPTLLWASTDPEEEEELYAGAHEAPRCLPPRRRQFLRGNRSLSSRTETHCPAQYSDPRELAGETWTRSARRARDLSGESLQDTDAALAMQLVLGALTGSRLDEEVEATECCPRCGNRFMPDAKFCRRCGQERCSNRNIRR